MSIMQCIHSTGDGQYLAIINKSTCLFMDICTHFSYVYSRSRITAAQVGVCLALEDTVKQFSKGIYQFTHQLI